MRIQLVLDHQRNQRLPINYQYLISSWIYQTLGRANVGYATQLHERGYDFAGKKYKLFTFDSLRPERFGLDKKNGVFILQQPPTVLELSFYVDEALKHFAMGLFAKRQFSLRSGRFKFDFVILQVNLLEDPIFRPTMRFRLKTPLCISRSVDGKAHGQYCSPKEDDYAELLLGNLLRKQIALVGQLAGVGTMDLSIPYHFELLSVPSSKLYDLKGIKARGYLFSFVLTAPVALMALGYFGGFGEKNSNLGMGMVKCIDC